MIRKKVIVVDDHPVVRFAVKTLLEKNDMQVILETESGIEAIKKANQADLVVLDIGLPQSDGFQILKRIKSMSNPPKVLILSTNESAHIVQRCQQAGADGYVTKSEDFDSLFEIVRLILRNYRFFPQLEQAADSMTKGSNPLLNTLTPRELSVLILIAQGLGNKQIGEKLLLSEKTISTYKHKLKIKLNANSVLELIDFARHNELV
ncbi:response regulator transcription factor [Vibrio aphrogenes]|uniref:response regulator transcription factor n=1 Tax=Vibrio aphrogenes TaxID=1891186 RepID=UPI0018D5A119|nr:response regulator transcription factor [Vibrio aphrogenes]